MPTYSDEWDKGDYRANNEQRGRMGFGGTEHGGQQYASRSRMLGEEAGNRGAYVSDMAQSNQSRGHQYGALDALAGAALGTAPSQAAIEARLAGDRSRAANVSMAGGVKGGPGARVAATRAAMAGNAMQGQQIAAQAAAARAGEMAQARGQYAGAATATRGTDLDAQRIQQQNELAQRQMNDAQRRFFEQQGTNIQVQDQNNQLQQQQLANNAWSSGRAATQSDEAFGFMKDTTYAKTGAAVVQGGIGAATQSGNPDPNSMGSDERMKNIMLSPGEAKNVYPFDAMSGAAPASFDKLSPSGGMNVLGSLKAHSDFATRFQSDPSGGMMLSPGEAKIPVSLDDAMQRSYDGRGEPGVVYGYLPDPYARETPRGVTGAPKGYAAERAGQAGSMFAPPAEQGYVPEPIAADGQRMAPGTGDFERSAPKAAGGGSRANILMGALGGLSGRNTMVSDDRAKLKEAFEEGAKYADAEKAGKPIKAPDYARAAVAGRNPAAGPKTDPKTEQAHAERTAQAAPPPATGYVSPEQQRFIDHPATQGIARAAMLPLGGFGMAGAALGWDAGKQYASSDEHTKRVISLDDDVTMTDPKDEKAFQAWKKKNAHPQDNGEDYDLRGAWKAGLKPGADGHWPDTFKRPNHPTFSDESKYAGNEGARPGHWEGDRYAPPRSFDADEYVESKFPKPYEREGYTRVNSRAEHEAEVKKRDRAVQDKASKDADAMMAGMQANLDRGASVKPSEGYVPDAEMYAGMKAMKPSLYAYKPEFKPGEQAPGELQVGPMANPMAEHPVTATALVKDPKSGLLAIDKDKALKLSMGAIATLAEDVEELKRKKGGR